MVGAVAFQTVVNEETASRANEEGTSAQGSSTAQDDNFDFASDLEVKVLTCENVFGVCADFLYLNLVEQVVIKDGDGTSDSEYEDDYYEYGEYS